MILAWTGRMGAGKTYGMVEYAYRSFRRNRDRQVFANFDLEFATAEFETWDQLVDCHNALVLLDELPVWAAARKWKDLSDDVASWFAQSRKNGLHMLYTAQAFQGVDATIRRLTAQVTKCERWAGLIHETIIDPASGERLGRRWHTINMTVCRLYQTFRVVGRATDGDGNRLGWALIAQAAREAERAYASASVRRESPTGVITYATPTLQEVLDGAEITLPTPALDIARAAGQLDDVQAELERAAQLRQSRAAQEQETATCQRTRPTRIHVPRRRR